MPIEGFVFDNFAQELSLQAKDMIPSDMDEQSQGFITEIVYKFAALAGSALNEDPNLHFNVEQACMIVQFIAEWTFHKSIDIIRAKIPVQFREALLQKVAFTIFEIAKQAVLKGLNQDQTIMLVEAHVKKAYKKALDDMKKRKVILDEIYQDALKQSNIDNMAKEMQKSKVGANVSDIKLLKFAAFTMFLKQLSEEKQKAVIAKLDKESSVIVNDFLKMKNLENHVNKEFMEKSMAELKQMMPEKQMKKVMVKKGEKPRVKKQKPQEKPKDTFTIIKEADKEKLTNLIEPERFFVKKMIIDICEHKNYEMPQKVLSVILKYMDEKLRC